MKVHTGFISTFKIDRTKLPLFYFIQISYFLVSKIEICFQIRLGQTFPKAAIVAHQKFQKELIFGVHMKG